MNPGWMVAQDLEPRKAMPYRCSATVGQVGGELDQVLERLSRLDALAWKSLLLYAIDVDLEAPRNGPLPAGAQWTAGLEVPLGGRCAAPEDVLEVVLARLVAALFSSQGFRSSIQPGGPYCQTK